MSSARGEERFADRFDGGFSAVAVDFQLIRREEADDEVFGGVTTLTRRPSAGTLSRRERDLEAAEHGAADRNFGQRFAAGGMKETGDERESICTANGDGGDGGAAGRSEDREVRRMGTGDSGLESCHSGCAAHVNS